MGDDHTHPHALQLHNRTLVIDEVTLSAAGIKLQEELVGSFKTQLASPLLNTKLHECRVGDLKPHSERKAASMLAQQGKRGAHTLVIEIRIAAMRRAYDLRDAGGAGGPEHLQAHRKIASTVINTGQDMAMDVPQLPTPLSNRKTAARLSRRLRLRYCCYLP